MAKYRKKPVVVEAEEYKEGMEDGFECCYKDITEKHISRGECEEECWRERGLICFYRTPYINTLEGKHYISKGDYIITGIRGERYPIKPDIFKETYEPVEETNFNSYEEIIKICNQILPYVDDGLAVYIEKILELAEGGAK